MSPVVLPTLSVILSRKSYQLRAIYYSMDSELPILILFPVWRHLEINPRPSHRSQISCLQMHSSFTTLPRICFCPSLSSHQPSRPAWNILSRLGYFHRLGTVNLIYFVIAYWDMKPHPQPSSPDIATANMQEHGGSRGYDHWALRSAYFFV